jgi:hypothetical protein
MLVHGLAAEAAILREALQMIKITRWQKRIQDVNDNDQIIVKNTQGVTVSKP